MVKKEKRNHRIIRLECRLKETVKTSMFIESCFPDTDSTPMLRLRAEKRLRLLQDGLPASLRKPVNIHEEQLLAGLERLGYPEFVLNVDLDDIDLPSQSHSEMPIIGSRFGISPRISWLEIISILYIIFMMLAVVIFKK